MALGYRPLLIEAPSETQQDETGSVLQGPCGSMSLVVGFARTNSFIGAWLALGYEQDSDREQAQSRNHQSAPADYVIACEDAAMPPLYGWAVRQLGWWHSQKTSVTSSPASLQQSLQYFRRDHAP
jgi:hypothetical protein